MVRWSLACRWARDPGARPGQGDPEHMVLAKVGTADMYWRGGPWARARYRGMWSRSSSLGVGRQSLIAGRNIFVTDLSATSAQWYIVRPHTSAHVGSAGLGTGHVRVNVLGWGHEVRNVGPCSPGHYADTLYDLPPAASVRLLIDESGQPSVGRESEPSSLPSLSSASLDELTEDQLCHRVQELLAASPSPA